MKWKSLTAALLGAVMLSCAGGCSLTDLSRDDLLRPPKTMGDEAEIEQLIAKTSSKGYTLKYPKSGSYRSAIVMHDLNGDDINEAIAFFRDKDGATGVHMLVMYEDDGKWKISSDFVTETTDVDSVDFADINDNSAQEILVGYATYTANVNFLAAYTYESGKTNVIESGQNYSAFYCGNLDSSGKSKVITLSLFSPENEAKATLLEFDSKRNALYAKATAPMDPNVVSYKNVSFTDLDESSKGLVVDGALASNEMNTQVIYFNKELNLLRNPLYKEKTENPTKRASAVLSTDIGNDMKTEVPTVSTLPYSDTSGAFTAADQIIWNTFSVQKEELVPVQRTAANYNYSFTVKIPETWLAGTFTVLLNESGDLLRFCEWNKSGVGEKLFDIKVFKVAEWDQGKGIDGYTLIYKDNRSAFAFVNYAPESALAVTDDSIKTAFSQLAT